MEQLQKILVKNDITFTSYTKWKQHYENKWIDRFAGHLTAEEQQAIHLRSTKAYSGYLWHLFSFEKRPVLAGKQAIDAFNNIEKQKIIVFHQTSDKIFVIENGSSFTLDLLPEHDDYYIIDENCTWSFNTTHEQPYIGPFYTDLTL